MEQLPRSVAEVSYEVVTDFEPTILLADFSVALEQLLLQHKTKRRSQLWIQLQHADGNSLKLQ